ncbi:MAG: sigma-70 family RNA polymerase sigma factor, partial [Acidimicrobiales bacterium]
DPLEPAVSALDARAQWPRVAEAVAALPEAERTVLLLYAWEELGYDEIAETLEVPVGTVRSRLHRARSRLRAMTEGDEAAGPPTRSEARP